MEILRLPNINFNIPILKSSILIFKEPVDLYHSNDITLQVLHQRDPRRRAKDETNRKVVIYYNHFADTDNRLILKKNVLIVGSQAR